MKLETENKRNPVKHPHYVGTSMVLTIDPIHIQRLGINADTFFEEKPVEEEELTVMTTDRDSSDEIEEAREYEKMLIDATEKELLKCETCRKEFVGYKELNNHLSQNKTHKPAPSQTLDGINDYLMDVASEVTELYAYIRQRLADTNNINGYYLFVASTVITNILETYIKESEDEKHPDEVLKVLKESAANFTRDFKDLYAL